MNLNLIDLGYINQTKNLKSQKILQIENISNLKMACIFEMDKKFAIKP